MPAKDRFHDAVRHALEKDGWIITDDPYVIKLEGVTYDIDLGAEKVFAAEKAGVKIAVEVKSFIGASFINNFHQAIGQFVNYLVGLENKEPDRELYLAIPEATYIQFFKYTLIQETISRVPVKLLLFEPENETVIQWIPMPATRT